MSYRHTSYLPVSTMIFGTYRMNESKSCNSEIKTTLLLNIRVNTLKLSFWDKKEQIKVKWKHWKYQFNSLSIKVYIGSWYGGFYFISFIFICYSSKYFYYPNVTCIFIFHCNENQNGNKNEVNWIILFYFREIWIRVGR